MKIGIIGAGPSGLVVSNYLKSQSHILEKNNHPGGTTSSFSDEGYTFDIGPHILFSKNQEVLDYIINTLGDNVAKCRRNNKVSYKGKLMKYPFENDLRALPLEETYDCIKTYLFNPYKEKYRKPKDLKQWLLAHFGEGICKRYLFPYNEKVWNIPVDKLSMLWADRIPNPPAEDILKSAIGFETEGYLHQLYYYYPLTGGYQAICDTWANGKEITFNFTVTSIEKTKKGTFIVSNGDQTYEFDQLVSTMPVHELIKVYKAKIPDTVKKAVKNLIVNPLYTVSLGIKGEDKEQYTAIYFPEKEYLFNRISFPKTFSPNNAPKGHYSIQAEITCRASSKEWKATDSEILEHVKNGLVESNIIKNKKDIVYEHLVRVQYAYVVYDTNYEKNVSIIRKWFPKQGIHLAGRFSYFEYINTDGAVIRAREIADIINKQKHEKRTQ